MRKHQYAVIMAGGSGTRLWPMSRQAAPKQFQKLVSERTLIQETYDRLRKVVGPEQIYVATIEQYKDLTLKQLPEVAEERIILEPASRNTSPAFGLLALILGARDPQAVIATVASDHVVYNTEEFVTTFKAAFQAVDKFPGKLVAVGIKPDKADTGLGYIKMGSEMGSVDSRKAFQIDSFVEKPDAKTAAKYIKSWQYLWNAAYYFWRAKDMVKWLSATRPKVVADLKKIVKLQAQAGKEGKIRQLYQAFENEQIEYAVVEKLKDVIVIPADLGWSDVGNWGTLQELLSTHFGTAIVARGHHIDHESQNVLVYAHEKMVATVGLKDVIIVDSPDAILVAGKDRAQDIKKILDQLKAQGKHLYL